ncbi:hypothetical protein L3556_01015 [Candidatus Synechococcus calcipolaris G9]|uniref:Tetratricopeptide repeat protein n=2 Tax=Synechococcus TaxID=1129 RepID=A0ABT6EUG7_9SYNE|nr:hypothetical protein [Candidatus Synechococcus calcipolaris G9]
MTALEQGDYAKAEALLQPLPKDDPMVIFCTARLELATEKWEAADANFRHVLRLNCGPKLTQAARQGLLDIEKNRQEKRQAAIDQISQDPHSEKRAALVLEGVPNQDTKTEFARKLAQVLKLDAYVARLLIPSRGWRLLRLGTLGELRVYSEELKSAGIPLFCLPIDPINQIQVLEVRYIQALQPKPEVICTSTLQPEPFSFVFTWPEVEQRVEGLLPIFEAVVDRNTRGKIVHKEQVQDHAQCCDLHLIKKNIILRFYRGGYQFNRGIDLSPAQNTHPQGATLQMDQNTSWANWRQLTALWNHARPGLTTWNEFTSFAETSMDFKEPLGMVAPRINLFRQEDSYWDTAFMVYSGLAFLRQKTRQTALIARQEQEQSQKTED